MPDGPTLVTLRPQGQQEIEELLEATLVRVRAGEVESLALAYVHRDGQSTATFTSSPAWAALRGAVAYLGWRMDSQRDRET